MDDLFSEAVGRICRGRSIHAQRTGILGVCLMRKWIRRIALFAALVVICGLLLPENREMPVVGATASDWNAESFWYEPWGSSGTHKGIDVFAQHGTPVQAGVGGFVVFSGRVEKGGNIVLILGPKWRIHYYAHLDAITPNLGWVKRGDIVGSVGDSGNAVGKQPHLHYSVLSLVPIPWLATTQTDGWKRMFYLDPLEG